MVVMRDRTRQISRMILVNVLTTNSKIPLNTKPAPARIARSQPMLALIVVALPTSPRPPVDSEAGNARSETTAMAINAPSCARKMSAKIRSFHLSKPGSAKDPLCEKAAPLSVAHLGFMSSNFPSISSPFCGGALYP